MINYNTGELLDIVTESSKSDPEVKSLSYALKQAITLLISKIERVYLFSNIDELPENIVDLLAAELRTQYYDASLSLDKKRELVRNTLPWHMIAGTPAAVEELINVAFGGGKVKEWFEYGGNPYTFKVETLTPPPEGSYNYFLRMIQKVKNTRSKFDGLDYEDILYNQLYAGIGLLTGYEADPIQDGWEEQYAIHMGWR